MKRVIFHLTVIAAMLLLTQAVSCGVAKIKPCPDSPDRDSLIELGVSEFLQSNTNLKLGKIFQVFTYDDGTLVGVGLIDPGCKLIVNDQVLLFEDYTCMPSKIIEKEGKIFYWRDEKTLFTEELLKTFSRFDHIEYDSTGTKIMPDGCGADDSVEGFNVYWCRCDLNKKAVTQSNVALGYGKLPSLKCPKVNK